MTNVTFKIDDTTLLWARMRALKQARSLNAVVVEFLEQYAEVPDEFRAAAEARPAAQQRAAPARIRVSRQPRSGSRR